MTPTSKPSIVALIPARKNSKRLPGKNTKMLGGKPLIAWTIDAAKASSIFQDIYVSSDDEAVLDIAYRAGAVALTRPPEYATDDSPDIEWVKHARSNFILVPDAFAILRPTSPFRTSEAIRDAWGMFRVSTAHSLRAVQPVHEHPGKMWQIYHNAMWPFIDREWPAVGPYLAFKRPSDRPWHSQPTQTLPTVYVQNASLEMAWTYVLDAFGTISGERVAPFIYPTLDINTPEDWAEAERYACQMTLA